MEDSRQEVNLARLTLEVSRLDSSFLSFLSCLITLLDLSHFGKHTWIEGIVDLRYCE